MPLPARHWSLASLPVKQALPRVGQRHHSCLPASSWSYLSGRTPEQGDDISTEGAMNDTFCETFFRRPTQPLHRRYEALRAAFVEHRPLQEVAQQYGYRYGSLRNLVGRFRTQCRSGQVPPFSLPLPGAGPSARPRPNRSYPPSRIAASSASRPGAGCAAVPPACSCSCRCWPACASISW